MNWKNRQIFRSRKGLQVCHFFTILLVDVSSMSTIFSLAMVSMLLRPSTCSRGLSQPWTMALVPTERFQPVLRATCATLPRERCHFAITFTTLGWVSWNQWTRSGENGPLFQYDHRLFARGFIPSDGDERSRFSIAVALLTRVFIDLISRAHLPRVHFSCATSA